MKNALIAFLLLIAAAEAGVIGIFLSEPAISTTEIDRDRSYIAKSIEDARKDRASYSGGMIATLIDARLAISENTAALLDQKRFALIRRVSLSFQIAGQKVQEASDSELHDILAEIDQAQKKAEKARSEASRYSGGLLQSMSLMTAATDEMTISQLRLKFYSAKYGLLGLPGISGAEKPALPPGKVVQDKEAL